MAYELYIFPPEGASGVPTQTVVEAFRKAGVSCIEQPDDDGHWLVLDGFESALDLTIKEGVATGAAFRLVTKDDPSVIEKVAAAFKSIGWQVSDDEGFL